jgi:release factor glutamine methyltransferase
MSLTLHTLRRAAEARLRAAGVDTPELDARLLIQHALGLDRTQLLTRAGQPVADAEAARAEALIARREAREPVGRILGRRGFWTLELALSSGTLEPRPDTETVVEAVLATLPDPGRPLRLLDLGTGTGCLLLALLAELPDATGLGIDISTDAVATATTNAEANGLGGRAAFRTGDWTGGLTETFDVVVSNPPYIPSADIAGLDPEVRDHDPLRALDGGTDGYDAYRALAGQVAAILCPGGLAAFEVGRGQAPVVAGLMTEAGLRVTGILSDAGGIERCVRAERSA